MNKKYSGELRIIEKELFNLGSGKFIFVCAQNDLFCKNIPFNIPYRIINHCKKFDNKYLFQSKNTDLFEHFDFPKNTHLCTTIESDIHYPEIMKNSPIPYECVIGMVKSDLPKYVTIEPILKFNLNILVTYIKACEPIQVNIGADSQRKNLPEPTKEEINKLIAGLNKFTKVECKDNLNRLLK